MVEFAKAIDAGHLHHVSSIAAAGLYEGVFREDMFDEAEGLDHPYFMTKHESEKIVRKECKVPWTVYRPAAGGRRQPDRRDGQDRRPVLLLQADPAHAADPAAVDARRWAWRAGASTSCRWTSSSPRSTTSATASTASNGKCFHLVDPMGYRVGDVLDIFSKAAHAPKMNLFVNAALLGFIPKSVKKGLMALAPVRRIRNAVMKDLGLPDDMLHLRQLPDALRPPRDRRRAQGQRHRMPEPATTTPGGCGTTGSATSTPTCSSTAA